MLLNILDGKIRIFYINTLTCWDWSDSKIAAGYSQEASPSFLAVRLEGDNHVAAAGDGGGQL